MAPLYLRSRGRRRDVETSRSASCEVSLWNGQHLAATMRLERPSEQSPVLLCVKCAVLSRYRVAAAGSLRGCEVTAGGLVPLHFSPLSDYASDDGM